MKCQCRVRMKEEGLGCEEKGEDMKWPFGSWGLMYCSIHPLNYFQNDTFQF